MSCAWASRAWACSRRKPAPGRAGPDRREAIAYTRLAPRTPSTPCPLLRNRPRPPCLDSSSVAAPAEADGGQSYAAPALEKGLDILIAASRQLGWLHAGRAGASDRPQRQRDLPHGRDAAAPGLRAGRRERPLHPHAQDVRAGAPPAAAEIALVSVALLLRELASRARSPATWRYQGGRVVVIAQVESPERWSFGLKVGVSMGLTDTSWATCCWPSATRSSAPACWPPTSRSRAS